MPGDSQPIQPDELEGLFGAFKERTDRACVLAVSGGSDSTALMVLFADWLRQGGSDTAVHTVLTVDHGLRPGSTEEAREVGDRALALGFRHAILQWHGPKPQTGIQAAARAARYRLICGYMETHDIATLLAAHTRDDQAETLLMRLARGSGLDGLAAMAPWTEVAPDGKPGTQRIVRPLLGVAKARLQATLEQHRIPWIEDPSNQSPAFERSRWRAARGDLEALGLSSEMLASSARRLLRARVALEAVADTFCAEDRGLVRADRCGLFHIDREKLRQAPEEIAVRVVGRCIAAAGGSDEPVPLAGLEPIVSNIWRGSDPANSWTLARAHIKVTGDIVTIQREPGRLPLPAMTVAGGTKVLWDGRYIVEVSNELEDTLELRALGRIGRAELKRLGYDFKDASALLLVPAFWQGNALLAVPAVDFWARIGLDKLISADFVGLRYNSGTATAIRNDDVDAR